MSGNTAVILVSDGKKNVGEGAAKAAQELNNRSGDRFCFYTVLAGNDPAGEAMYFNYFITLEPHMNFGFFGIFPVVGPVH